MTSKQKEKALQIARMCMEVTAKGQHSANFNYAGHAGLVSVYIDDPLTGYNAHARLEDDAKIGGIIAHLQELGATPPIENPEATILAEMQAVAKGSVRAFCLQGGHREATFHKMLAQGLTAHARNFIKLIYSLGFKITR